MSLGFTSATGEDTSGAIDICKCKRRQQEGDDQQSDNALREVPRWCA